MTRTESKLPLITPACFAAAAVGMTLVFWCFWPGYLDGDSEWQLSQAQAGVYDAGHPPLMAWIWHMLLPFIPGAAGMLVFHNVLFWLALVIIFSGRFKNEWLEMGAILAVGLFPPIFSWMGSVWKDVSMFSAFVLAIAFISAASARESKRLLWLALLFLFYGAAVRHNGIFALPPLLFWWGRVCLTLSGYVNGFWRSVGVGTLAGILLVGGGVLVNRSLSKDQLHFHGVMPWSLEGILTWDLAGISVCEDEVILPDFYAPAEDPYTVDELSRLYTPRGNWSVLWKPGGVRRTLGFCFVPERCNALLDFWIATVKAHPVCYLIHRTKSFIYYLGLNVDDVSYPFNDSGDRTQDKRVLTRSPLNHQVFALLYGLRNTLVFRAWIYNVPLILFLFTAILLWLRRFPLDTYLAPTAVSLSALAYSGAHLFVAPTTDFRYSSFTVIAALLCPFLFRTSFTPYLRRWAISRSDGRSRALRQLILAGIGIPLLLHTYGRLLSQSSLRVETRDEAGIGSPAELPVPLPEHNKVVRIAASFESSGGELVHLRVRADDCIDSVLINYEPTTANGIPYCDWQAERIIRFSTRPGLNILEFEARNQWGPGSFSLVAETSADARWRLLFVILLLCGAVIVFRSLRFFLAEVEPKLFTARDRLMCFLLLVPLLVAQYGSITELSQTYDEGTHWQFGRSVLNFEFLRSRDSVMPVSALNALPRKISEAFGLGSALSSLQWARSITALFGVLLGLVVFRWSYRLYGRPGALLSLLLYVCCPNVIAHSTVVTTDLACALMTTVALYAFWSWQNKGGWNRAIFSSATFGVAQIAKYTNAFLLPLLLLVGGIRFLVRRRSRGAEFQPVRVLLSFLLFGVMTFYVVNFAFLYSSPAKALNEYSFESSFFLRLRELAGPLADLTIPLPVGFVEGLDQVKHNEANGGGYGKLYLLGELRSDGRGFASYYLWATLLKVPLVTQLLFVAALISLLVSRGRVTLTQFVDRELFLLVPILFFYTYFSLCFGAQTGFRYVLPALPLAYIFIGRLGVFRHVKALLGGVAVSMLVTVWSNYPDYLAYFNVLVQPPGAAYRYLADSNLDWGQSRLLLERYLADHPDVHVEPVEPRAGRITVGANYLTGVLGYPEKYEQFRWLRENFSPVGYAGGRAHPLFDVPQAEFEKLFGDGRERGN